MHDDLRFNVPLVHRFRQSRGVFAPGNPTLAELMPADKGSRVAVFIDDGVLAARPGLPGEVMRAMSASPTLPPLATEPIAVPGGERVKNDPAHLDRLLDQMHDAKLCRRSYAMVVGGGAVLDAVGLAAALTHRGVRLVRLPTTTLAQDDSGVGVKNGVNRYGKKNFLGAFAAPWAVVNDPEFLMTLSERDWRSGFSEAVKVALIRDAGLFERIERDAAQIVARDLVAAEPVIERSARLHLEHITLGGDPFELDTARPLDFGHWAAHKLEQMSGYTLRHGEAVAIGVVLDSLYASAAGLCDASLGDRVGSCLASLGFALGHPLLERTDEVMEGLEEFREHLGGELTVSLPAEVGRGLDVHEIDRTAMVRAMRGVPHAAARWTRRRSG